MDVCWGVFLGRGGEGRIGTRQGGGERNGIGWVGFTATAATTAVYG